MVDPMLFSPIHIGDIVLQHRVVLAPLTRNRVDSRGVLLPLVKKYYSQRANIPGTLLISEPSIIGPQAGGQPHNPGIWSDEQIAAWKEVADSVHSKGSFIFCQLWALGRAAYPDMIQHESFPYVSASNIQHTKRNSPPRPLTIEEIEEYIRLFATAASNAVHKAGFDGVEIHNASGYLPDQFLQDVTNVRQDDYGGSIKNRARFSLEVVEAVVNAVGQRKTGIRFTPWDRFQDMRMSEPTATFAYITSELKRRFPNMAYLSVTEPRVHGFDTLPASEYVGESNDFLREIWKPNVFISCGAYTRETALQVAEHGNELIASGRAFLANPDLPLRWKNDLPLNKYDRTTFYMLGDTSETGYTDYPFWGDNADKK
ncbi:hypothetical protein VNI00_013061 [Paramarasmius palmivorus]|uniref:NADH:flavin oxidoreductase/NADH oxidase N-terminal domain-containing protein n=1 Tax=Paramarasmius palmivorus TaxID=297713 RepID=A0AAW0C148_9AGAR